MQRLNEIIGLVLLSFIIQTDRPNSTAQQDCVAYEFNGGTDPCSLLHQSRSRSISGGNL